MNINNKDCSLLLTKIIDYFRITKIDYCIERNYEKYPDTITGDVDIIVESKDIRKASEGIMGISKLLNWKCYHSNIWLNASYIGLSKNIYPDRFALTIELYNGGNWKGAYFLPAREILDYSMQYKTVKIPCNTHEILITAIHHLLYNGRVPQKYRNKIRLLIKSNEDDLVKRLVNIFGKNIGHSLASNLINSKWSECEVLAPKLRFHLTIKKLLLPHNMLYIYIHAYLNKLFHPKGIIIYMYEENNAGNKDELADTVIEIANKWHIFSPPIRKIFNEYNLNKKEIKKIVNKGGVVVVKNKKFKTNNNIVIIQIDKMRYNIRIKDELKIINKTNVLDDGHRLWNIILNKCPNAYAEKNE